MPAAFEDLLDRYLDRWLRRPAEDPARTAEGLLADAGAPQGPDAERLRAVAAALALRALEHPLDSGEAGPFALPERIGSYRVVRLLGRGGQGVVLLAEDARLPRRVALKLLTSHALRLDDGAAAGAVARLRREAEAVSRLDHPGLSVVHELGHHDGLPYIAMRFVEGETLAARLLRERAAAEAGPRPGEAARLARAVELSALVEHAARALHAAHEAGVVHRDVKPGNLMIDTRGQPVVLDFGLAHVQDGESPALTATGAVFGSPAYMAPEQVSPEGRPVDRRADVWALGVTLFEALALRRPFEAPTRDGLYQAIRRDDPPSLRRLDRALPRDLCVVVETALAKDPAHRYASALDLAEDLRRVRERQPILARRAGAWTRTARWAQRNPALAAASLGVVLSLAGGLATATYFLGEARESLRRERASSHLAGARAVLEADPTGALRLALESEALEPSPEARDALLDGLERLRERRTLLREPARIGRLAPDPAGERVAVTLLDPAVPGDGVVPTTLPVLRTADGAVLARLRLEGETLHRAAWSPDGGRLAATTMSGRVVLFEAAAWEPVATWRLGSGELAVLEFSPDGRWLAVGGTAAGGPFAIQDASTGADATGAWPRAAVQHAAWSPDGAALLVATLDGEVLLGGPPGSGREPRVVLRLPTRTIMAAFDAAGARALVTCYRDGGAHLLDVRTGEVQGPLEGSEAGALQPCFVLGDTAVAMVLFGGRLARWDAASGRRLWEVAAHDAHVHSLHAADGGESLLSAGADGLARLWDARSGQVRAVFGRHPDDVLDVLPAGPGRVWTAGRDGTLREWDRASGADRARRSGADEGELVGWDARSELLLLSARNAELHVRALDAVADGLSLPGHPPVTRCAAVSPDGRRLATGGMDGLARLHDARDGRPLAELPCREDVWHVAFSADGARLAASCGDGVARVWDVESGSLQLEIPAHVPGVRCSAFTPDGALLLTASEHPDDGRLRAWDARDGSPVRDLFQAGHRPIALAVSPDGRWAASGGWDRSIVLWDLRRLERAQGWEAHADRVNDVAFSRDGRLLASAGFEGAVTLWALPGPARLWTSEGREGICGIVGFTTDGARVVGGVDGYGVRTWPVDVESAAREALGDVTAVAR